MSENHGPAISTLPGAKKIDAESILNNENTRKRLDGIAQSVRVVESEIILAFRDKQIRVLRAYLQTSALASGNVSISVRNDENKDRLETWLKDTHRFTTTPMYSDGKNSRYIVSF